MTFHQWIVFILLSLLSVFLLVLAQRLRKEAARRSRQRDAAFAMLTRIGEGLTTRFDINPVLKIVADYIIRVSGAESGAVFLFDPSRSYLQARVVRGSFPAIEGKDKNSKARRDFVRRLRAQQIAVGRGIIGQVAQSGKAVLIDDMKMTSAALPPGTEEAHITMLMAAPMLVREQVLGVVVVGNKRHGGKFSEQDFEILQTLADQAAAAVDLVRVAGEASEQQRLRQELLLAQEFQSVLLPQSCPTIPGIDLAAYFKPAREIGGDFYDFIPLDDGKYGIVIADATGKGIPGAIVMAGARSALRAEARRSDSPREILHRVNEQVLHDTKPGVFITMIYGILDPREKTFRFVRAGHEPLLLLREDADAPEAMSPAGMALGLVGAELFDVIEEQTLTLRQGETLLLFTDGAIEATNETGEEYGHKRLHEVLLETRSESCSERLEAIVSRINSFAANLPQHDDLTLVAIRDCD